jgi:hypothetical protein
MTINANQGLPVPPPSADLLAAVARGRAVVTRRPLRTLAAVNALSLAGAAVLLAALGLRPDPSALALLLAFGGLTTQLVLALVPARGNVLPRAHDSALPSVIVLALTTSLALLLAMASGHRAPPSFWLPAALCMGTGLLAATLPIALGLLSLRGVLPGADWRTWLALGAGAGVLGGQLLQLHCPNGGLAHLLVGHGLAMLAPALLLGIWAALPGGLDRRRIASGQTRDPRRPGFRSREL